MNNNFELENIKDKVLLHYKKVSTYDKNKQTIDQIVEPNLQLEVADTNGNISFLEAKDSKGRRACRPIEIDVNADTSAEFDPHYVRLGYALTMKTDPQKGKQIRLPKKETELRELFNFTDDKKASVWTHDYDEIVNLNDLNDMQKRSFFRGVFSCRARIRPGPTGYIVFDWEKYIHLPEFREERYEYNGGDFINVCCETIDCNPEYNGCQIFIQSREQLYEYITTVGFVQSEKVRTAMNLYRAKVRVVNDVIPINADNYLLYHVENYGDPKYYTDKMATDFNINAIQPRNKKSVLATAMMYTKHDSLYPALWLLKHGAKIDYKSKKQDRFDEMLKRDRWYFEGKNYYEEFLPLAYSYIFNEEEYTKMMVDLMFWNYSSSYIEELFDNAHSTGKLQKDQILHTILEKGNYNINFKAYDTHVKVLNKIIEYSSENLEEIAQTVIEVMTKIIKDNEGKKYSSSSYSIKTDGSKSDIEYHYDWKRTSDRKKGYYYISNYDLYVPLLDCLLKKIESKFENELKTLQGLMDKEKIIIYRKDGIIDTKF